MLPAIVVAVCLALLLALIVQGIKRRKDRQEIRQHSITPEGLHEWLASNQEVLLFDVRQPLDLLAYPEIIPGAIRIPPREVLENPFLIPKDKDSVIYCTCPSDKTSTEIWRKARAMDFSRLKILKGGLEGWKAQGYRVESYEKSFRLDAGIRLAP